MAAPTAAQLAELRRMTAEPTTDTYSDELLVEMVARYPLTDERGQESYTWDAATTPPSKVENTSWVTTYDLHAAAADVWQEKAAALLHLYDFSADGGSYSRSQMVAQANSRVRFHLARRNIKTIRQTMANPPVSQMLQMGVINLAEPV